MTRRTSWFGAVFHVAVLATAAAAQAAIIRESAGLGTIEFPSVVIGAETLAGSYQIGYRFTLGNVAQVEQVGGRMRSGTGTLFAAIISLSGPSAMPSGDPFDATTLATVVFSPPAGAPSVDIRVPMSITLNPGSYALLFGSGYFGAFGSAWMPLRNPEIADRKSFIAHGSLHSEYPWREVALDGPPRLVLEGELIPEPSMALLAAAAIGLVGVRLHYARSLAEAAKGAIS